MTPRHFPWQAWHLVTSTFVSRGRRGTNSHRPSFGVAGVAFMALGGALGPGLVARDAAALCVAGVALGDIHLRFASQTWRNLTSTVVLRGRCGTNSHPPSFCVAGVALMALGGALGPGLVARDASNTSSFTRSIFHTQLCHTHTTTYIHTYPHTYIRTYVRTYIHTYLPFYLLDLSPPPLSFLPSLPPLKPLKLIIGRS